MKKEKKYTIFGYGSLMNLDSLKRTVKKPGVIKTAILRGYKREFSLQAKRMISRCGPVAVLDISESPGGFINGIFFEINKEDLEALKKREILYDFIKVDIFTEKEGQIKALTVQARGEKRTDYKFDCELQDKYFNVCLSGAKSLGNDFYKNYLKTTFIKEKNILETLNKLDI